MMTGPAYRRAARFFFEPTPRPPMAHPAPFVPHAHREPAPEPLWKALVVYAAGILIGLAALYLFGGPG